MTNKQKKLSTNQQKLTNGMKPIVSSDCKINMTSEDSSHVGKKKNKKKTKNNNQLSKNDECNTRSDCNHCINQREINHVDLEENQLLWSELKEHIRYMYKIGRDQNLGPTVVHRVKHLVDTLCSKDIHQLFIRLELLAIDVIRDCLESADRIFVNDIRNATIALSYLENIIADCDNYLFSARKMLPILKTLEAHLKKFNICWILLHQNLFRIHYLEDRRCKIRAKQAKLLLLTDLEMPAFTETILKFSQFSEMLNALSEQWRDSIAKIQRYRESKQFYKNYQIFLNDCWQNFNIHKKKEKPLSIQNAEKKNNLNKPSQNGDGSTAELSKKARRRSRVDNRPASTDLMPPPPPRTSESDSQAKGNLNLSDSKSKKKLQYNSETVANYVGDNRDVDSLVAFVEGLNINSNKPEDTKLDSKARRKRQKKEKQRLKKVQNLMEADRVAQLITKSSDVTITMVPPPPSNDNLSSCLLSSSSESTSSVNSSMTESRFNALISPQKPLQNNRFNHLHQTVLTTSSSGTTVTHKMNSVLNSNHNLVNNCSDGDNPGSRMVTIRRVNEANTDEPTVTITLKGPTPEQDQVLYRIINGQADYGHLADDVLRKKNVTEKADSSCNSNTVQSSTVINLTNKKKSKKANRHLPINDELTVEPVVTSTIIENSKKKAPLKEDMVHITKTSTVNIQLGGLTDKKLKKNINSSSGGCTPPTFNNVASLTNTFSNKKSKGSNNVTFLQENIKHSEKKSQVASKTGKSTKTSKNAISIQVKPLTTDKSTQYESSRGECKQNTTLSCKTQTRPEKRGATSQASTKQTQTNTFTAQSANPTPFTSKIYDGGQARKYNNSNNTARSAESARVKTQTRPTQPPLLSTMQTQQLPAKSTMNNAEDYKMKTRIICNQQRNMSSSPIITPSMRKPIYNNEYGAGQIIPAAVNATNAASKLIPENLRLPAGITITKVPPHASTSTATNKKHPVDHKKYKPNVTENSNENPVRNYAERTRTGKPSAGGKPSTSGKPSPNVATDKTKQVEAGEFDIKPENRQPPIGTGVPRPCDAPAKFIRAPDGRIIIRNPMAVRSTTPPLNPLTMIRQDLEMGVPPPANTPFWPRNEWWLPGTTENVFAPKDIDLEDNSLDAEERELEAFKRFCQEPVSTQRQEITHLNVQNIIIKKNHS